MAVVGVAASANTGGGVHHGVLAAPPLSRRAAEPVGVVAPSSASLCTWQQSIVSLCVCVWASEGCYDAQGEYTGFCRFEMGG